MEQKIKWLRLAAICLFAGAGILFFTAIRAFMMGNPSARTNVYLGGAMFLLAEAASFRIKAILKGADEKSTGKKKKLKEQNPDETEAAASEMPELDADVEEAEASKKKFSALEELLGWVKTICTAMLIALILTQYVILNVTVPTGSMEDTILPGDRLIGLRFSYWFSDPERGDIVIFQSQTDGKTLIKRVIGLPGETVEIRNGKIYIDGAEEPLKENYLKNDWVAYNDGYFFEIPKDCYLMLGDNRNNSLDARFWADEALKNGKASTEEEARQYSYVSSKDILGKAVLKYYSRFEFVSNDAGY